MQEHLIIITQGKEDGGRAATQGAELSVTLQALRRKVYLFLTLGGTRWAFAESGRDIQVSGHLVLEEYFERFLVQRGELWVCAPCVASYCYLPSAPEETPALAMRPGARYVGLATVAELMIRTNATVF